MALQDDSWELNKELGKGCSGAVFSTSSVQYPNVVLKRGPAGDIVAEAERLWGLRHPSVVQVYAVLYSRVEDEEEEPVKYMALARLGRSLEAMLDHDKMYAVFYLMLRAYCMHVVCQCHLCNQGQAVFLLGASALTPTPNQEGKVV